MKKPLFIALIVLTASCTVRQEGDSIDIDPVSDRIGDWSAGLQR